MKNLSKVVVVASLLVMCLTTTVFGADGYFSDTLKKYQQDVEVSTIRKSSYDETFIVSLTYIEKGVTNMVCVWTENDITGDNYSDPYEQIKVGLYELDYFSNKVPSKGTNVTLNMDNPVKSEYTVDVAGVWTPN